jgi:Tol biopolymer transport system component/DNA-binding winged helix-turn-helix (wHTH) protein
LSEYASEHEPGRDRSRRYKQQLRIGDYVVDPGALSMQAPQGDAVRVKPKAMAVLLELARQPGVTVSREELLDRVWQRSYVTPGVVAHAITALRRGFGDSIEQPAYIETIPRIGYRLLASVDTLEPPPSAAPAPPAPSEPAVAAATEAMPGDARTPAATARRPRAKIVALVLGAALVAAAALLATGWFAARETSKAATQVRIGELRRVTFAAGSEDTPRLNTAGDWLVYSAAERLGAKPSLLLQSSYGTQALPLADNEHAERPTWSPQGRSVAYVWRDEQRCQIRIYDIDARTGQTIARCPAGSVVYLDWSPADPALIAYTTVRRGQAGSARLQLLRNNGGWRAAPFEYDRTPADTDLYPRFSPDGRRIAFRRSTNPTSDLYVVPTRGGKVTRVTRLRADLAGFDWLPDASGLVLSSDHAGSRALYVLDLDDGAVRALGVADATSPDISASGWRLSFRKESWRSTLATLAVTDGASPALLTPSSGRDRASAIDQDGRRVFFTSDRDGSSQLWALDLVTRQVQRLTQHSGARVERPVVSADGTRVLYVLRASGRYEIWEYRFDAAAGQRIATFPASVRNAIYAGDGTSIWFTGWHGQRWALHRCLRTAPLQPCTPQETPLSALRVEHAADRGGDMLVLQPTVADGRLQLVSERSLRPLRELSLPPWVAWSVVDDAVWFLREDDADTETAFSLHAAALSDGTQSRLATYRGLERLPVSWFAVTPDRRQLLLPVVTENSSDIMLAQLLHDAR